MLAESDLRELVAFTTGNEPVLSVYLDTEMSSGNAEVCKLRLKNMLKAVNLPEDVSAVERFINLEYKWSGRGVAIFSCASRSFFKSYSLALPLHDWYQVSDRPGVKPLVDLLDIYGGYGVVLVDKQEARLFYFHLGELREQEVVEGEQVKHTKAGGASSVIGQRGGAGNQKNTVDETIDRNMREAVEGAVRFFEEKKVRRVVLAGQDNNIAMFRNLLPKAWQSLVVGSFAANKNMPQAEILQRTLQIGLEAEQTKENHLVENLMTRSAKGDEAVVGLEATLQAINAGRVQTLVLVENFHLAGYRCDSCGRLTSDTQKTCSACEGPIYKYPDVVELAVSEVIRMSGEIEVIGPHQKFIDSGSIGALLRY